MISLRVPDDDLAVIDANAEAAQENRTEYMINCAKNPEAAKLRRQLARTRRQLRKLVVELNAILGKRKRRAR